MLRLGSILAEEKIEEVVEIIFFSEACFHKILCFLCCSTSIFCPRANDKFGTPLGGGGGGGRGGGLAPLDLSVREGDRKNQFAMRLNCA